MKTLHKIIIGDSRQMKKVPDESVHLIITSPPYWQLKDYGNRKQIGFNDSYEEYINNLNLVWNECHRVLHKDSAYTASNHNQSFPFFLPLERAGSVKIFFSYRCW